MAKIVKKYGKNFGGKDSPGLITPNYTSYQGAARFNVKTLDANVPALIAQGKSLARLDNLECQKCGSTYRVEMHHIRMLKDLNPQARVADKLMAKARRKQIPLCRDCHMKHHHLKI